MGEVCNGASGASVLNGTFTSVNLGTQNLVNTNVVTVDSAVNGYFAEAGLVSGAWGSSNAASVRANARQFWGF